MNPALSTHQLLKLAALVIMTVDHLGAFLYPDAMEWRAFGRLSFPIWFFLVGHALDYHARADIYLWALVLAALSPLLGLTVFPLNSLLTILLVQRLLVVAERHDWLTHYPWTVLAASFLLLIPTMLFSEYGSAAFLYAFMGHAVRRGQAGRWGTGAIMAAAFFAYVAHTALLFTFTRTEWMLVLAGVAAVTLGLRHFRYRRFDAPPLLARPIGFVSHHSMQYYVAHRVVLQAIGLSAGVLNPTFRWI